MAYPNQPFDNAGMTVDTNKIVPGQRRIPQPIKNTIEYLGDSIDQVILDYKAADVVLSDALHAHDVIVTDAFVAADSVVTTAFHDHDTIVLSDAATAASVAISAAILDSVFPVGFIAPYMGATAPLGNWLLCDGQTTFGDNAEYAGLKALLGTNVTPDLRGKTLVMKGSAPFDTLGTTNVGSLDSIVPNHTHTVFAQSGASGTNANAGYAVTSILSNSTGAISTGAASSGASVTNANIQPSAVINYIIKY
jgi:microcystin-dependent protein